MFEPYALMLLVTLACLIYLYLVCRVICSRLRLFAKIIAVSVLLTLAVLVFNVGVVEVDPLPDAEAVPMREMQKMGQVYLIVRGPLPLK